MKQRMVGSRRSGPGSASLQEGDVREQLLSVGAELFAAHGFDGVSLHDICAKTKLSKGAIYHYFLSKEELAATIVGNVLARLVEFLILGLKDETDHRARLSKFIVLQAEYTVAHPADFRLAMIPSDWITTPELSIPIEEARARYVAILRAIILEGMKSGEFQISDYRPTLRAVLAFLYWLARWYRPSSRISPRRVALDHAELLLRGLQPAPMKSK